MSFAEDAQYAAEIGLEHFRESFLLCFRTMTDGLPQQYARNAREVIKFFETETTPQVWERLKTIPDPATMQPDPQTGQVDPAKVRSLADTWLAQWEQLTTALGGGKTAPAKASHTNAAALSNPAPGGY